MRLSIEVLHRCLERACALCRVQGPLERNQESLDAPAAENWGRAQGCTEFASDTQPDNEPSIAAHQALGFEDAGLLRCFRREL